MTFHKPGWITATSHARSLEWCSSYTTTMSPINLQQFSKYRKIGSWTHHLSLSVIRCNPSKAPGPSRVFRLFPPDRLLFFFAECVTECIAMLNLAQFAIFFTQFPSHSGSILGLLYSQFIRFPRVVRIKITPKIGRPPSHKQCCNDNVMI